MRMPGVQGKGGGDINQHFVRTTKWMAPNVFEIFEIYNEVFRSETLNIT